jgi:hypothetical protein
VVARTDGELLHISLGLIAIGFAGAVLGRISDNTKSQRLS